MANSRLNQFLRNWTIIFVALGASVFCIAPVSANAGRTPSGTTPALQPTIAELKRAQRLGRLVRGELLIKWTDPRLKTNTERALRTAGISWREIERFRSIAWQRVKLLRLPRGYDTARAIAEINRLAKRLGGGLIVFPNYRLRLPERVIRPRKPPARVPSPGGPIVANDPQQTWGIRAVSLPDAWQFGTGSDKVVVAVLDTGVNYRHEDLKSNMWRNPREVAGNGRDDDGNGYVDDVHGINAQAGTGNPMDDQGHGTHCAGIIGAIGNNGRGSAGVNWTVRLMALKWMTSQGGTAAGTTGDAIRCYEYMIAMRKRGVNIRVASNSWGGGAPNPPLADSIYRAAQEGILSVYAAGNDSNNNDRAPVYPASYRIPGLISVAASDRNDRETRFTNFGATSVHIAAPGEGIISTYYRSSSDYASLDGTSMAAPFVSGAAALLWAIRSDLTVAQVTDAILQGAETLPHWRGRVSSGGRLDVAQAIERIKTKTP